MADTINGAVIPNNGAYHSITSLFPSIAAGTGYTIQNQGDTDVRLVIQAAQPQPNAENYILLPPYPFLPASVTAGENQVWVMGRSRVAVQTD